MYQLQFSGAAGQTTLQWDPQKLREQDPGTVAIVAEADRLLKAALAQRSQALATSGIAVPRLAVAGRWLA